MMDWTWLQRIYQLSATTHANSCPLGSFNVKMMELASYVREREHRWTAMSWKCQSTMWLENQTEESIVTDGLCMTSTGKWKEGSHTLDVYVLPSFDGHRVIQHHFRRDFAHAPLWGFDWSREANSLILMRGSSPQ